MKKLRLLSAIFACVLSLIFVSSAHAIIIEIDPGNVGDSPGSVTITSPDILDLPADGRTVEWDFVFSDMKYVELTNPFSAGGKKSAAVLLLNFGAEFCDVPDCVPFQRPILGTQIMYLSDENGAPIPGTGVFDAGVSNGSDTAQYNIFAATDQNNPTLIYHGLHFNITLPVVDGLAPTEVDGLLPTITSATLSLAGAFQPEDRIIGQWIPIPPALWLFSSGLLGLIGIARRKKA